MRKNWGLSSGPSRPFGDRRWLVPFLASLLVTATIFLAALCGLFSPPYRGGSDAVLFDLVSLDSWDDASPSDGARSVESGIKNRLLGNNEGAAADDDDNPDDAAVNSDASDAEPPRIAYLLEGTKGDGLRMRRTLQAIYHPRNQYILHLDLEAPPRERIDLAMYVKGDPLFSQVGNVRVIAKGNLVTYKGPTMVACTLHAVAILLKEGLEWDWFINLSASDYPLMTQDDILHVFSSVPRNLNFIEHFQLSGWKVMQRAKPIVLDPGLYLSKKFDLTMTTERRELPTSFKLFTELRQRNTARLAVVLNKSGVLWSIYSDQALGFGNGSAWIMLTKSFLEYCIWGWDNLPRNLLMYYVNFISSPEGYFQTVICNSEEFQGTAVGHDLHYIAWDYPPKQHPRILSMKDFNKMVKSGAPFARKFPKDDSVLDKIDRELLHRSEGRFTPGAWCDGSSEGGADPCSSRGEDSVFEPGPGAERLRGLMKRVLSWDYRNGSCSTLAYDQTKRDWYLPKSRG